MQGSIDIVGKGESVVELVVHEFETEGGGITGLNGPLNGVCLVAFPDARGRD